MMQFMADENPAATIGLIPAAGRATRLGRLPTSKELLPVAFAPDLAPGEIPRVACSYVLEQFRTSGIDRAFIVLRQGKWDIPGYLEGGSRYGVDLAYLVTDGTDSLVQTLALATPFTAGARVALGLPDILLTPTASYKVLAEQLDSTHADVVLGLYPAEEPERCDMVRLDEGGWVRRIEIKQPGTRLEYAWINALWRPSFTRFLVERQTGVTIDCEELHLGHLFQEAVDAGMKVLGVTFPSGWFIDIGTPGSLWRAVQRFSQAAP